MQRYNVHHACVIDIVFVIVIQMDRGGINIRGGTSMLCLHIIGGMSMCKKFLLNLNVLSNPATRKHSTSGSVTLMKFVTER